MACVATLPITIYRGRSFAPIFNLIDGCSGLPIDVTPYTEIEVDVLGTISPCVAVLFSLGQVNKIVPFQGGQIQPLFTAANTLAMALTDPTQAAAGSFTAITIKLTNPANPDQNPFVIVVQNALNILDSPC
jgi:hypothetical protein